MEEAEYYIKLEKNYSIAHLENYFAYVYEPVAILMVFFMVFGIVSNICILYIYISCIKKTILRLFIINLSFVDLTNCLLGIPLGIVHLLSPLTYHSDFLCRLRPFILYTCCIASVFILFSICCERYNSICRSTKKQLTVFQSKVLIGTIHILSVILSLPCWLIYSNVLVDTNLFQIIQCVYRPPHNFHYYSNFLTGSFLFMVIAMITMYSHIYYRAKQHFSLLKDRRDSISLTPGRQFKKRTSQMEITQINFTVIAITLLFIISYLPTRALMIVYNKGGHILIAERYKLILNRSWILNCSLNPLVYGACNKEFRKEFEKRFH